MSKRPVRKITVAGVAGAVTVLIVFVLGMFGVPVPPEVAASMTTLIMFGAGYFTEA